VNFLTVRHMYRMGLLLAGDAALFELRLAGHAAGRVGRGDKPLIADRATAIDAFAVAAGGDARQRRVDLLQFVEVVPRERSAQLIVRLARCRLVGMRLRTLHFRLPGTSEIAVLAVQRRQQFVTALAEPLLQQFNFGTGGGGHGQVQCAT